jgi:hypothetical protein
MSQRNKGFSQGWNMELSKKLFFIFSLVVLASCNEKVAPELKNSGVTDGTSDSETGTVDEDKFYFRLKNNSSKLLNYQLHRTGPNNFNGDAGETGECKIHSSLPFSNELFTAEATATGPTIEHDSKVYDISCYYDMEELALYANGFEFEVETAANACEYVAYSPFSFFERMPGNSTKTVTKVICDSDVPDAGDAADEANVDGATTQAACNQYLDNTALTEGGAAEPFSLADEQDLCLFDYSDETGEGIYAGQNCDIGTITVNDVTVTYDEDTTSYTATTTQREIECGGRIANCIQGPIRDTELTGTIGAIFYYPDADEKFTQEYSMEARIGSGIRSSLYYANYRSTLANPDIDYGDYTDDSLQGVWSDITDPARKVYDPEVMEYFANNQLYKDDTEIIDSTELDAASIASVHHYGIPYAADPFLGLVKKTQPFYSFYCLDAAFDVKAKIRMVVREWDRTLSKNASLENLTDYIGDDTGSNTTSRQDNPVDQEIPGYPGFYNNFNDSGDFDNLIPMIRTTGTPATVEPVDSFFNSDIFPNGTY